MNAFGVQILLEGLEAALAPVAALLPTTPRRLLGGEVCAVDGQRADFEPGREL